MQERERAIVEFHRHAFEHRERGGDFDQVEHDRLFGTKHRARGDAKKQRVTDLAGRAGDGNVKRGVHERKT